MVVINENETTVAPMVEPDGVCICLNSGSRFYIVTFGRSLVSVAIKMMS